MKSSTMENPTAISRSSPTLRLDIEDLVDVESVSSLVDQSDMSGLIDFLFLQCGEIRKENNHMILFAFGNWLVTTFDRAVEFLHTPNEHSARFQRLIVKQIAAMLNALLSGLRSSILGAITKSEAAPSQPHLYPSLHEKDPVDLNPILAQYDELCLRVTDFFLSNVPSPTTRLTCWRRFARITPLHLFSTRAKIKFYLSLVSSISSVAGDVEEDFCEKHLFARSEDSTSQMDGLRVVTLLRTALIDQGWHADSFITVMGRLASQECRPPPYFNDQLWHPSDIPTVERLLVERILDILFRVKDSPTSHNT